VRDESYKIEVFVFPDGTAVEMIVFDTASHRRGAPAPAAPARPVASAQQSTPAATAPAPCCVPAPPREREDVHRCPVCGSRLVYPIDWERSGDAAWTLQLRCPECETRREVVLGRASVEQLNRELYHGAQAIAREAELMTRRNFEDEAERIVAALERDLIQPMDF
jgi:DNA-directed RNA polymerase subunit RPC12/RpoP